MDVRRQAIRLIQRTDPNKADRIPRPGIIAPQRDMAHRAAADLLALAAVGRRIDDFHFALQQHHPGGFDHGVERKRRPGLPLAPAAMAAVHEQRLAGHAVAHRAAGAAAVEILILFADHRWLPSVPESIYQNTTPYIQIPLSP